MWAPAEWMIFALAAFALGGVALLVLIVVIFRGALRNKRSGDDP